MKLNGQSEITRIESVLVKHVRNAWRSQEHVDSWWRKLYYPARPDYKKAEAEYEHFIGLLREHIPQVYELPANEKVTPDSLYPRDPVVITGEGAILLNMGKEQRRSEAEAIGDWCKEQGIPILGSIKPPGTMEGGDLLWFDEKTLAVGISYRTNREGVRQFRELTRGFVDEIIEVPMPHANGPEECLHLMCIISPIDVDLAVVYSPLMVVPFRNYLLEKGIKLIEVPPEEYARQACNILAFAPRKCIMVEGNPRTQEALEKEGVEVYTYPGEEICIKGGGGPTCLTRPLFRG